MIWASTLDMWSYHVPLCVFSNVVTHSHGVPYTRTPTDPTLPLHTSKPDTGLARIVDTWIDHHWPLVQMHVLAIDCHVKSILLNTWNTFYPWIPTKICQISVTRGMTYYGDMDTNMCCHDIHKITRHMAFPIGPWNLYIDCMSSPHIILDHQASSLLSLWYTHITWSSMS